MRRLITLTTLAILGLGFTSCLEDTAVRESPRVDGFSDSQSLNFSAEELAVLREELNVGQNIEPLSTRVPEHLSNFRGNEVLEQSSADARKALLGRVLFYDTRLSATGETSCNTCHLQEAAFADNLAVSEGINGLLTKRNSIALGAVPTFAPEISGYGSSGDEDNDPVEGDVKFFWDERAATIKEQSLATIQDEREMGKDIHELSSELSNLRMYQILSMKAYGTTDLTPDRITLALEKFTSSITAMNTRFDQAMDNGFRIGENVTESEMAGFDLFLQNCASCHGVNMSQPNFAVANNGLDVTSEDKGVGGITGNSAENGLFKVPFLRNVALTAPYMHDGRFETLREVIDHYSEGIQRHPNLHRELKQAGGTPIRMNFSEEDKQALVDFLNMATDETIATNPAFANPFRE